MPHKLRFTGGTVSIPSIGSVNDDHEIEFKLSDLTLQATLQKLNSNNRITIQLVSGNTYRVLIRSSGATINLDWTDAAFSPLDEHVFKIHRDALNTHLFVDDMVTPKVTVNSVLQYPAGMTQLIIAGSLLDLHYYKLTFPTDSTKDRFYNPSTSNGTGTTLHDDTNGSHGTISGSTSWISIGGSATYDVSTIAQVGFGAAVETSITRNVSTVSQIGFGAQVETSKQIVVSTEAQIGFGSSVEVSKTVDVFTEAKIGFGAEVGFSVAVPVVIEYDFKINGVLLDISYSGTITKSVYRGIIESPTQKTGFYQNGNSTSYHGKIDNHEGYKGILE